MMMAFRTVNLSKAALPRLVSSTRTKATVAVDASQTAAPGFIQRNQHLLTRLGAAGLGLGLAQYYLGEADDFFEHKFTTTKQCQDLADFYGTEDFMEVFCVFPFVVDFMMRKSEFDDDGTIHAWGLLGPGELKVSIDFDEREEDTDGDGEPDTITWFNKRETFHDKAPAWLGGFTLWKMTQNFGYNRKDDGSCVVYHHGEKFNGLFPMRLLFELHSRYVIWATERYVNSEAFGSEEREDQAVEIRHNVPLHAFNEFIADLTAQVEKVKSDSQGDVKKQRELEVTLQRLNTIAMMDQKNIRPRVTVLTSRRTMVPTAHLVVDDQETKDTIRTAMNQIASAGKGGNLSAHPTAELRQLQRRLTLASMEKPNKEK